MKLIALYKPKLLILVVLLVVLLILVGEKQSHSSTLHRSPMESARWENRKNSREDEAKLSEVNRMH